MPDDGSAQSSATWPLPKFSFEVNLYGDVASFQEVSGLASETQVIEYRGGNSPQFSTVKMPGIKKYGNITLKKGVFKSDSNFWDWYNQIAMNTIKRAPITISLLDETGAAAMVWTLANAWPTKITATDLKPNGNQITVDTIEIAHEGLAIANS